MSSLACSSYIWKIHGNLKKSCCFLSLGSSFPTSKLRFSCFFFYLYVVIEILRYCNYQIYLDRRIYLLSSRVMIHDRNKTFIFLGYHYKVNFSSHTLDKNDHNRFKNVWKCESYSGCFQVVSTYIFQKNMILWFLE